MTTYAIYSPAYNPTSGGVIALHKLAHNIAQCGGRAHLYSDAKNPEWEGELKRVTDRLPKDAVAVYPEVTAGNYLGAKHVLRWLLSMPGNCGKNQTSTFRGEDFIFAYSSHYARDIVTDGLLTAFDWGLEFWTDEERLRKGTAYVIRKGSQKEMNLHEQEAIGIDGYQSNLTVRDVFNRVTRFVSYDHMTMLSVQAALCGAESIVAPAPELSAAEWRRDFPYFRYGIAYGTSEEEREYAHETVEYLPEWLAFLEKTSRLQTLAMMMMVERCK